jgi:hypothetical protein
MSKLPKLPAIQFYSGDWRKDLGVQSLSLHDRAVWFEMLLLMHESEERGFLVLNGKPIKDEVLARLIGLDKQILTTALTNIEDAGVSSRREDGAIFNRRMVKDEKLRQVRTEAGKLGGNPALVKQKETSGDKQIPTPSSSVSVSTSKLLALTSVEVPAAGVFELPLIGEKGEWQVPESLYRELVAAYPGVSVLAELAKMRAWLITNPLKRKTASGLPRAINSWLGSAQNSIATVGNHGSSSVRGLTLTEKNRLRKKAS